MQPSPAPAASTPTPLIQEPPPLTAEESGALERGIYRGAIGFGSVDELKQAASDPGFWLGVLTANPVQIIPNAIVGIGEGILNLTDESLSYEERAEAGGRAIGSGISLGTLFLPGVKLQGSWGQLSRLFRDTKGAFAIGQWLQRRLGAAAKPINLPAWRRITVNMRHIADRHMVGGPHTAGRTVFPSTMSEVGVMRAVREAYESSRKIGVQGNDRVKLLGDGGGLKIEMWFNKATNTIESAYPITP